MDPPDKGQQDHHEAEGEPSFGTQLDRVVDAEGLECVDQAGHSGEREAVGPSGAPPALIGSLLCAKRLASFGGGGTQPARRKHERQDHHQGCGQGIKRALQDSLPQQIRTEHVEHDRVERRVERRPRDGGHRGSRCHAEAVPG